MKLTIFTGLKNGSRFFDHFLDGEGFTAEEYADCIRFDFTIGNQEIEENKKDLLEDEQTFFSCLHRISATDKNRFIHKAYRSEIDRELISDAINSQLEKIVVDNWIIDCLFWARKQYKGV